MELEPIIYAILGVFVVTIFVLIGGAIIFFDKQKEDSCEVSPPIKGLRFGTARTVPKPERNPHSRHQGAAEKARRLRQLHQNAIQQTQIGASTPFFEASPSPTPENAATSLETPGNGISENSYTHIL